MAGYQELIADSFDFAQDRFTGIFTDYFFGTEDHREKLRKADDEYTKGLREGQKSKGTEGAEGGRGTMGERVAGTATVRRRAGVRAVTMGWSGFAWSLSE